MNLDGYPTPVRRRDPQQNPVIIQFSDTAPSSPYSMKKRNPQLAQPIKIAQPINGVPSRIYEQAPAAAPYQDTQQKYPYEPPQYQDSSSPKHQSNSQPEYSPASVNRNSRSAVLKPMHVQTKFKDVPSHPASSTLKQPSYVAAAKPKRRMMVASATEEQVHQSRESQQPRRKQSQVRTVSHTIKTANAKPSTNRVSAGSFESLSWDSIRNAPSVTAVNPTSGEVLLRGSGFKSFKGKAFAVYRFSGTGPIKVGQIVVRSSGRSFFVARVSDPSMISSIRIGDRVIMPTPQ